MDLFLIRYVAPLFYQVMTLSLAAVCIGLGVFLVRKLADKRISPFWKNALWILVLVALLVPYRPIHTTAVLPPVEVNFRQQENSLHAEITQEKTELDGNYQVPTELVEQREGLHTKSLVFEVAIPAIWLLGMAVMMGILVVTRQKMLREMRMPNGRPYNQPSDNAVGTASGRPSPVTQILDDCKHQLNITQSVEIVAQSYLKSPALWGLYRPKILLPDYVSEMSEKSQKYILLHELSHLKHHDLWKNTLLLTLQVVYWFNPLVWVLFRFIRQDMELLNDERVLKALEKSEETPYALSLIEVLGHSNKLPLAPQMLCMVDNKENTKRRIQMIQLGEAFKKYKIIIAVACLAVIGVLSALFLTAQPERLENEKIVAAKGLELYVWKMESGEFCFNLLPGTDRMKSKAEIYDYAGQYSDEEDAFNSGVYGITDNIHSIGKSLEGYAEGTELYVFLMSEDISKEEYEPYSDILADYLPHNSSMRTGYHDGHLMVEGAEELVETMEPTPYGITLAATDVTSTGMTLVCTQSGGGEYYTGEKYVIERLENHTWMPLTATSDIWYDIAWNITSDGTTEWELDWSYLYGNLEVGTYRLSKEIYSGKDVTNEATYYTQFEVKEERIHPVTGENDLSIEPIGDPKPLSPDELAYFNETYFNTDPMMSNLNLANQFLHSSYASPADIDLYMLFYLGAGADYAMDDFGGEYDAVAQAYGFDGWADIPTDVTPIPKTSMDYLLQTYTGTTLADSNKVGLDGFRYLEEYDCYYNLHGDTNYFGNVDFTSGTQMGDEFRLYYTQYSYGQQSYVLTLHQVDDQYFIYSNLPLESQG